MTVKGTTISVIPEFIVKTFGEDAKSKWIAALTPEAQQVFNNIILPSNIYPLKTIMAEPTSKMCELFFNGDTRGAFDLGRFSADYALNGVYKFFIKFGSPEYALKKASSILPTYYQPSIIEVPELEKGHAVARITNFAEMDEVVEKRIAGWIDRGLELTGVKNKKVTITKTLTKGDPYTELVVDWE